MRVKNFDFDPQRPPELQYLPFLPICFAFQGFKLSIIDKLFMCPVPKNQFPDFISGIFEPLNKSQNINSNSPIKVNMAIVAP